MSGNLGSLATLTPEQITQYVQLGILAYKAGKVFYDAIKGAWKAHGLTDEQIDQLEARIKEEIAVNRAERVEMAKPDDGHLGLDPSHAPGKE